MCRWPRARWRSDGVGKETIMKTIALFLMLVGGAAAASALTFAGRGQQQNITFTILANGKCQIRVEQIAPRATMEAQVRLYDRYRRRAKAAEDGDEPEPEPAPETPTPPKPMADAELEKKLRDT